MNKILFCLNLDELTKDGLIDPEFVETLFTVRAEPAFDPCILTRRPLYEARSTLLVALTAVVGAQKAEEIINSTRLAADLPERPRSAVFGVKESGTYYLRCRDASDPDNVREDELDGDTPPRIVRGEDEAATA